jgi:hypothetical protein
MNTGRKPVKAMTDEEIDDRMKNFRQKSGYDYFELSREQLRRGREKRERRMAKREAQWRKAAEREAQKEHNRSLGIRVRATEAEMRERYETLFEIVAEQQPMTVRQVFYQAVVRGLIDKAENDYAKVGEALLRMRREGRLPYNWIVDNSRMMRKPESWGSPEEAIEDMIIAYRKDLWREARCYVEIWMEKDALGGVIFPITSEYDVPLMTAKGFSSETYMYNSAEYLKRLPVPAYIYHFGDYDHAGVHAGTKIEEGLRRLAPTAEIHFERIAVWPEQIREWRLPTRPAKQYIGRPKARLNGRAVGEVAVELDAIRPDTLRDLCRQTIERHLPRRRFSILKKIEEEERKMLRDGLAGLALRRDI